MNSLNVVIARPGLFFLLSLHLLLFTMMAHILPFEAHGAASATFTWEANPEPVDGYRLYYRTDTNGPPYNGTGATEGSSPVETGDVTSLSLHGLSETETYYFALTAYRGSEESDYTAEIILVPAPTTNILPIAADGYFSVVSNSSISSHLSASDPDNDPLTYTIVDNGSLGKAVITNPATGAFTYTPSADAAGNDAFSFKVNDGAGDSNTAAVHISITADNQPTAVISTSASTGDAPLPVQFDGSGSRDSDGTIVSYAWDFGDGGTAAGASVSHTYAASGSYSARLTVTDSSGGTGSASTPILVTIPGNEPPQAVISVPATQGVIPLVLHFDAGGSRDPDGRITGYTWNFGDGTTAYGISVNHTFTRAGMYTVTLEVKDDQGASGRSSRIITAQADEFAAGDQEKFPWSLFLPVIMGMNGGQ